MVVCALYCRAPCTVFASTETGRHLGRSSRRRSHPFQHRHRCDVHVYVHVWGPTAARVTEGRSLPGDSTLVCAAYHQFPLILNRIQRTKPAPRRSADVYIGITDAYIHTRPSLHILNARVRTTAAPFSRRAALAHEPTANWSAAGSSLYL